MLSLTQKRWITPDDGASTHPSQIIARLLAARDISLEQSPTLTPPSVYSDMEKACLRVHRAIQQNERIGIFGDYDCDGVTAVAQLVRFFRRRNIDPFVRLPHRVQDGYGLSESIVHEIEDAGVSLLITADTGITAIGEIEVLQSKGIDTIVTDHHAVLEELPPAHAIIHPVLSNHPLPHPSGSGVALSFVYALEQEPWPSIDEDIALAMFGTVADLVELRGSNRALTQLGLSALEHISDGPIALLRDRSRNADQPLSSTDIAFRIAPRINAAGRMDDPTIALDALLHGGESITTLDHLNDERKALTSDLLDRAVEQYASGALPDVLVSVSSDYPHGIIGLIAGRLTEQFGRPSMVAHTDGKACTASLRSPAHYNIADALSRCRSLLNRYGGHAQAAGCTFDLANLDALSDALQCDIQKHTDTTLLCPTVKADVEISAADITLDFCKKLSLLEPFGQGNAEPVFLIRNCTPDHIRACGTNNAHLQCRIGGIQAIGFNMGNLALESQKIDVLARLDINEWQGIRRPQIVIVDVRLARTAHTQSVVHS